MPKGRDANCTPSAPLRSTGCTRGARADDGPEPSTLADLCPVGRSTAACGGALGGVPGGGMREEACPLSGRPLMDQGRIGAPCQWGFPFVSCTRHAQPVVCWWGACIAGWSRAGPVGPAREGGSSRQPGEASPARSRAQLAAGVQRCGHMCDHAAPHASDFEAATPPGPPRAVAGRGEARQRQTYHPRFANRASAPGPYAARVKGEGERGPPAFLAQRPIRGCRDGCESAGAPPHFPSMYEPRAACWRAVGVRTARAPTTVRSGHAPCRPASRPLGPLGALPGRRGRGLPRGARA